jgi:integrase/recombinase XerD
MFNTGARVQEVLDLKVRDVRLVAPYQVRLCGKGNKIRICPIWAHTAKRLRRLIDRSPWTSDPDSPIFVNLHGAKLTRFGVRYLLQKRLAECTEQVSTLKDKRIHPHSLRHYVSRPTRSTVEADRTNFLGNLVLREMRPWLTTRHSFPASKVL